MFCPTCGKEINEKDAMCSNCGYKVEKKAKRSNSKRNKVLAFIIAEIVILGIFAILFVNLPSNNLKLDDFKDYICVDVSGKTDYKFYGIPVEIHFLEFSWDDSGDSIGIYIEMYFDKSDAADVKKIIEKNCEKEEEYTSDYDGSLIIIYSYDDIEITVYDDFTEVDIEI